VVVYKKGMRGDDINGLGYSQRGEVAWMIANGIDIKHKWDVQDFEFFSRAASNADLWVSGAHCTSTSLTARWHMFVVTLYTLPTLGRCKTIRGGHCVFDTRWEMPHRTAGRYSGPIQPGPPRKPIADISSCPAWGPVLVCPIWQPYETK
jgi:hypothetical protein